MPITNQLQTGSPWSGVSVPYNPYPSGFPAAGGAATVPQLSTVDLTRPPPFVGPTSPLIRTVPTDYLTTQVSEETRNIIAAIRGQIQNPQPVTAPVTMQAGPVSTVAQPFVNVEPVAVSPTRRASAAKSDMPIIWGGLAVLALLMLA